MGKPYRYILLRLFATDDIGKNADADRTQEAVNNKNNWLLGQKSLADITDPVSIIKSVSKTIKATVKVAFLC